MRLPSSIVLGALVCVSAVQLPAQLPPPAFFAEAAVDAPELAPMGPHGIGVRTVSLVHRNQVDILKFDAATGKAPLYDRPIVVEVWYPAVIPAGTEARSTFQSPMAGAIPNPNVPKTFSVASKALRDAEPKKGGVFPLVIVSHGYPGSRTFMSYISENLASKGYVVAAIDHTDSVFGEIRAFPSTLLNRSNDQLFVIEEISARARSAGDFLNGVVDASRVGVIGYSMGGYGALTTAGAGYSPNSTTAKFVPGGYLKLWLAGSPEFAARRLPQIKAVVPIAPWGMQPPANSWDASGLAAIRVPTLFIAGDQDDVSDFERGIKPAFEQAVNSDRCMLVYENARHNVGGNPAPPEVAGNFRARESFEEPVWRKDRIVGINQHFITAFLDLYLKSDEGKRLYLQPLTKRSNDGVWPLKPGEMPKSIISNGSAAEGGWKGFQRRWAVGLQMHCYPAGEATKAFPPVDTRTPKP